MNVVDGSTFESAGEGLARILNEGYSTPLYTAEQIADILRLRQSKTHPGVVDIESVDPLRCTGLDATLADYEGFPLGTGFADPSDAILVNERGGNQFPTAALYWADVEVIPSFPHSI